ncbi:MAG: hypothetical protein RL648_378 [Verrucomicrobiota bacterium]|jgi:multidrug efflux system membrane fusion protein
MNRSVVIALGILLAIGLYLLSGLIGADAPPEEVPVDAPGARSMTVRVKQLEAEEVPREVVLVGKSAPSRVVDLRAEVEGRVEAVPGERGRFVKEGDDLVRIETRDLPERLKQAKAVEVQSRLEFASAERLHEQGLRSEADLAGMEAALRGAEQRVKALEIELQKTRVKAPFDGFLQERDAEVGDLARIGERLARVIDLDPLIITAEATEFQRDYLKVGEIGHARLASGRELDGVLRYVASEADAARRTFTVELEVPNPDGELGAGFSAEIAVETERVWSYRISPALVSIADDGTFGIKVVDEADRVRFYVADLVKTSPEYIWVTGLPTRIRLITFGQGFVKEGDMVNVQLDESDWN